MQDHINDDIRLEPLDHFIQLRQTAVVGCHAGTGEVQIAARQGLVWIGSVFDDHAAVWFHASAGVQNHNYTSRFFDNFENLRGIAAYWASGNHRTGRILFAMINALGHTFFKLRDGLLKHRQHILGCCGLA